MTSLDEAYTSGGFIAAEVADLHTVASAFCLSSPPWTLQRLQVYFVVGSSSPWRLIEIVQSTGTPLRRMLCFGSRAEVRRAIEERLMWQRADEEFAMAYMAVAGGFPGMTTDWVPSRDFEAVFGPARETIRQRLCVTPAQQTVMLRR